MSAQSSAGAGLAGILSRLQAPKKSQMEALVPFAILAAVLLLVVRIPSGLLDIFVIISLISGVVILLNTMYVNTPLDFSIFPAVILFTTIFRLFLNVATTRSILSNAEAGHVINTFATYVTGGNEVVGLVIFLIIVIINFVVVTHGAQRIGEVAARFTLDALPGKQISIDADLNAGVINEEQARARRRKLERETEYFGAMDGASKFVQRDAMAGIILIIVNIGAGFVIGMLQMHMGAAEALSTFTSLTVGDGLVANIPALLISTATGIMVTKAASDETVGLSMITQLTNQSRPLMISAGFILVLMMVPGMPKLLMALAAGTLFAIAQVAKRTEMEEGQQGSGPDGSGAAGGAGGEGGQAQAEELSEEDQARHNLEQLLSVDLLELEIGYGLIPLVDSEQGGDLLERVNNIRKQIAIALGFIVPPPPAKPDPEQCKLLPGQIRTKAGECVCPRGTRLRGGRCVKIETTPPAPPPQRCLPGQVKTKAGQCVCPRGTRLRGKRCVPVQVQCPKGTKLVRGQCVKLPEPPRCKKGQTLRNGRCVTIQVQPQRCPRGTVGKPPNCRKVVQPQPRVNPDILKRVLPRRQQQQDNGKRTQQPRVLKRLQLQ